MNTIGSIIHAIVGSCDANLVVILPNVANGVAAIGGRGSSCLCVGEAGRPVWKCTQCVQCTSRYRWQRWNAGHAGAQHIRVPLVHSLTKGYRIEKRKVNCRIVGEDRHVEIVRHVKQGCELFVHADAPRAAPDAAYLGGRGRVPRDLQAQLCRLPAMQPHPGSRCVRGGWDGTRVVCAPNTRLHSPCQPPQRSEVAPLRPSWLTVRAAKSRHRPVATATRLFFHLYDFLWV